MNSVFFILFTVAVATLCAASPESALSSALSGAQKAVELSLSLLSIYAVWLGILKWAEDSGLEQKLSRILKNPVRWLFGKVTDEAGEKLCMNISANLLGMGGVATPMGIAAAKELDGQGNEYAMNVLFVLASSSLQLLPTSVMALRAEAGSASSGDIILPTLIVSLACAALSCAAVKLIYRKKKL